VEIGTVSVEAFVGGEPREDPDVQRRELVSPATGELLGSAPESSPATVAAAVAAARRAQPAWEATSVWTRAEILHRIADLVDERREPLARLVTLEQGKPFEAEALGEIDEATATFRLAAEDAKRLETSVIPVADTNKRLFTFRAAHGVYGVILPWNFPAHQPAEMIGPAIATGNTVVIKPSEWTPFVMAELMAIMDEAGVPPGVVNAVYGGGPTGAALVEADVDAIGFIGSHAVGEQIVRAAGLKRSLIEASGNGPVVVCADADLRAAALGVATGAFSCAGQVCCATERVLVDQRVHDAFVEAIVEETRRWPLGDPFEASTRVGPLTNEMTASKMQSHVADAVARGGTVIVGGERAAGYPTPFYYEPTVIDGVARDALTSREETFGPIVPIISVDGDDDALRVANDSHLGLQVSVYTTDLNRAFRFAESMRAGNVVVNAATTWWEDHVPFGGAAGTKSGWGRYGGKASLLQMTDLKTVVFDLGTPRG